MKDYMDELPEDARPVIVELDHQAPVKRDGPQFVGGPGGKVMILENGVLRDVGPNHGGLSSEELGYDEKVEFYEDNKLIATKADMAKNAFNAIKDLAKKGVKLVSAEERQRRLEICKTCEFHAPKHNRCRRCGCFLDVKVSMKAWHCPIKLW